jgi:hypothetical protein
MQVLSDLFRIYGGKREQVRRRQRNNFGISATLQMSSLE